MYQQNHVGMHRSDDAAQSWVEISRGYRPSSASPPPSTRTTATASTSSRSIPATPGACPTARPLCGARATRAPPGSGSTAACRSTAHTSVCSARGWRSTRSTTPWPLLRHEHRPGVCERRRRRLGRDRELPAGHHLGRGGAGRLIVADVYLPSTLSPLFPGLERRLEVDAATVQEAIDRLDERWPGLRALRAATASAATSTSTSTVNERRWTRPSASRRVDVIAAISEG